MEILHQRSGEEGTFYMEEQHVRIAEMTYRQRGEGRIIIEHTFVSEKYKGQGLGKKLVDFAANHARKTKLKIVPLCSFAKAIMEKDNSYKDVL